MFGMCQKIGQWFEEDIYDFCVGWERFGCFEFLVELSSQQRGQRELISAVDVLN